MKRRATILALALLATALLFLGYKKLAPDAVVMQVPLEEID